MKAVSPPGYSYSGNMQAAATSVPPYNYPQQGGHLQAGPHQQGGSNHRQVEDEEDEYDRGAWGSKAEFILSCVGFSVSHETKVECWMPIA